MRRTSAILTLLTAVVMLLGPLSAQAQTPLFDEKPALWWRNLEVQLISTVDSEIEQIQVGSMQHIIFFATYYGDHVAFDDAVPDLLDLYASDRSDALRTLALVALHAIDSEYGMRELRTLVKSERSERVQRLARTVLAEHYNGRESS